MGARSVPHLEIPDTSELGFEERFAMLVDQRKRSVKTAFRTGGRLAHP
jgi:hypothetical protein